MYLIPADPRWEWYDEEIKKPVIGPTPPPDTTGWGPRFPTWVIGSGDGSSASADSINRASTEPSEQQLTVAAENAPIRFGYGRDRIGAQVVNVLMHNNKVVIQLLWGFPLFSIESLTLNDDDLPDGTDRQDYLDGTQVAVDTWLEDAFAAQSPTIDYNDTLEGFSYTVLRIPKDKFTGGINFNAIVNWRKVYDYRTADYDGTDNPSLALADFLTNSDYGAGLSVDSASVIAAANWNDTLVGGEEKSRLIGWSLSDPTDLSSVVETLRTYAGVFLVRRGNTVHFVCDKIGSAVASYSHASGQIQSFTEAEKKDLGNLPTTIEVKYTDISEVPWRERSAFASIPDEGERRLSSIRLNGIQRHSQARREAVERLNKLVLSDLTFSITVFDIGVRHEIGDIVSVTIPILGGAKDMRVAGVSGAGPGLWKLDLVEYDPSHYSSEVTTQPTYPDTDLPTPDDPPTPTSLTAAQYIYQGNNGIWNVCGRMTWTHSAYDYVQSYQVEIYDGTTLVDTGYTTEQEYTSPPLQDLTDYTVRVRTISTIGAQSEWAGGAFSTDGKSETPGNVASIAAFEVGGDVYLSWSPVADWDIWRYELRYGPTTENNWDNATLLDRVDALRYISKGVMVAGEHRIYVKAVDSIRQYSPTAAYSDVSITVDPDSLKTRETNFTVGTSTYAPVDMQVTEFGIDTTDYYITEHGSTVGAIFTASPLGTTYDASPIVAWQGDATNTFYTSPWDAGVDLTGDWTCDIEVTNISGTATVTLMLADAASYPTYTDYTSFPVKTTARHARIKVSGTGEFKITMGSAVVECYAVTRKEYGVKTCTGGGPYTVTLEQGYFKYRSITAVPVEIATPAYCVIDNITLDPDGDPANTFQIWIFDEDGAEVNCDVSWKFEGI